MTRKVASARDASVLREIKIVVNAEAGTKFPPRSLCGAMSRVAAYRSYAAECLALAEKTTLESERLLLVEMAASWHELALMLESYMDEHDGEEPPFKLSLPKRPDSRH